MAEPDLRIPWTPQTQWRRILLTNGAIVDIEEPVNNTRHTMADAITERWGDNVAPTTQTAITPILHPQQELL